MVGKEELLGFGDGNQIAVDSNQGAKRNFRGYEGLKENEGVEKEQNSV